MKTSLKDSYSKSWEKVKKVTKRAKRFKRIFKEFQDPLKELGPGITSFHWLLTKLFMLFALLYFIHIPVINIFMSYS